MQSPGKTLPPDSALSGTIHRLYVLDYGLFQVHDDGRVIGVPGYLIQTQAGLNVLVDTGFPAWYADDPARASRADGLESFGRVLRLDHSNLPAAQLARIGLETGDIGLLVLTHTDIDHVGGIAEFPQATIVLGQAERLLARPRYFGDRSPIAWPDNVQYRVVHEDTALCPGVALLSTPGHSPGHLSLLVRLPETGAVLLAGDAISRPAELEEGFADAWDPERAQASAERLMATARREGALIIYGHDPAQWNRLRR
nr:MBL fold metallo-hydrolase [Xanthomonadales bacterium]